MASVTLIRDEPKKRYVWTARDLRAFGAGRDKAASQQAESRVRNPCTTHQAAVGLPATANRRAMTPTPDAVQPYRNLGSTMHRARSADKA
jgi:hypothetical protein